MKKEKGSPFAPLERDVDPQLRKLTFVRARCVFTPPQQEPNTLSRVAAEHLSPPLIRIFFKKKMSKRKCKPPIFNRRETPLIPAVTHIHDDNVNKNARVQPPLSRHPLFT